MTKQKVNRDEDVRRKRARRYASLLSASPALEVWTPAFGPPANGRPAGASRQAPESPSRSPTGVLGASAALRPVQRQDEIRGQGLLTALLSRDAPGGAALPSAGSVEASVESSAPAAEQAPSPEPVLLPPPFVTVHDPSAGIDVTYDVRGGAPDVDLKQVRQQLGSGAPLDQGTRAYMEWRFGRSFESVRVHTGPKGDALSKALSAHAFALGADLAFQSNAFRPGTAEGDRLLAHELTHIVQAGLAPALPQSQDSARGEGVALRKSASVSEPTDRFEIEADNMADQVVSVGRGEFQRHQRELQGAEQEEDEKRRGSAAARVDLSLQGGGSQLDAGLRARLEGLFERDLDAVRVHTGQTAAQAAASVQARAFTVGTDIVFGSGEYRPGTPGGDALIAHEVTHAVQSLEGREGRPTQIIDGVPVTTPTDTVEREAYSVEARVRGGALQDVVVEAEARTPVDVDAPPIGREVPGPRAPVLSAPTELSTRGADDALHRNDDQCGPEAPAAEERAAEDYSEDEINALVGDAQEQGQSQPAAELAPVEEPAVDSCEPVLCEEDAVVEPTPAPPAALTDAGISGTPAPPGENLTTWDQEKAGGLGGWDEEIAWHEVLKNPTAGPPALDVDRWALLGQAWGDGALQGVQDGAVNLIIGRAMQAGSQRIPYLAGFVEMAKIAYDPAAWLESTAQNTIGKFAQAGELWQGNWIDKIEAFVTVVDGVNNIISTISTILWIVAAAGFIASLFFPVLIPFVVWAANAARLLQTISGIVGIFLTVAKGILALLRSIYILTGPADPAALLQQRDRLRGNVRGFTGDYVANAGDSLIGRAQGAVERSRGGNAQAPQPSQGHANAPNPRSESRWMRVLSIASGELGDSGPVGSGMSSKVADAQQTRGRMQEGTPDRNRAEQDRDQDNGQRQRAVDEAEANLRAAQAEATTTTQNSHQAQERLLRAQQEVDALKQRLATGDPANAHQTGQALETHLRDQLTQAQAASAAKSQERAEWGRMKSDAEAEATRTGDPSWRQYAQEIGEVHSRLRQEENQARAQVNAVERDLGTIRNANRAAVVAEAANNEQQRAQTDLQGAQNAATSTPGPRGHTPGDQQAIDTEQSRNSGYESWGDSGSSRTSATAAYVDATRPGDPQSFLDRVLPSAPWNRTLNAAPLNLRGDANGSSDQDRQARETQVQGMQARYADLRGALQDPPGPDVVGQIDGQARVYSQLDSEQRQIEFQVEAMNQLEQEGTDQMSGLDVLNALADQNRAAISQEQGQLESSHGNQQALADQAVEAQGQAAEGQGPAGQAQSQGGPFVSRFMSLMGIVPSRVIGNGGGATQGANQLSQTFQDQGQIANGSGEAAGQANTQATQWMGQTDAATAGSAADDQSVAATQARMMADYASAQTGVSFIQETRTRGEARIEAITTQKAEARTRHDGAISTIASWIGGHRSTRLDGLTGLEELGATIQRRSNTAAPDAEQARQTAALGLSGPATAVPHEAAIQRSFGAHDISSVRAHTGPEAQGAARSMGAMAFVSGQDVAFAGTPDLFTAAHEAAHVVQQRAGVVPAGVGRAGDRYEQQADAVARSVVAGQDAAPLLDSMVGGGAGFGESAVQLRQATGVAASHLHQGWMRQARTEGTLQGEMQGALTEEEGQRDQAVPTFSEEMGGEDAEGEFTGDEVEGPACNVEEPGDHGDAGPGDPSFAERPAARRPVLPPTPDLPSKEEGGEENAVRDRYRSSVQATSGDLGSVSTDPGPPPELEIADDHVAADSDLSTQIDEAERLRAEAAQAIEVGPGPEQVQETVIEQEHRIEALDVGQVGGIEAIPDAQKYLELNLPMEVQDQGDALSEGDREAALSEAIGELEGAQSDRSGEQDRLIEDAELQNQAAIEAANQGQEAEIRRARGEIEQNQDSARRQQDEAVSEMRSRSDTEREQVRRQVDDRVAGDQRQIDDRFAQAQRDAEAEKAAKLQDAEAEKQRAEEKEDDGGGMFGWIGDALKAAFDALKDAINALADALVSAVNSIIDAAKDFATGLIDACRDFVVGALQVFGDFLKGLVNELLGDIFPGLAQWLNEAIDAAVQLATDVVNQLADTLKNAVTALLDGLRAGLLAAIEAYRSAINLAMDIALAAATGNWAEMGWLLLEAALRLAGIDPEAFKGVMGSAMESIDLILEDPGAFIGTMIDAVGQGFGQFGDNILTHLQNGFFEWIAGPLGEGGIQLPAEWNLSGIFGLVLQVVGLSRENIKGVIEEEVGETGAAVFDHVWGYVSALITGGLEGLWEQVQNDLGNLWEMVVDGIKNWVMETIVKQAVLKIATMWNPAGAIIQALITCWNVYSWLKENVQRIWGVVQSVVDMMGSIAQGDPGPAANAVEANLARLVPIAISLLANLLGLGGIGAKVKEIILKIQQPVTGAIRSLIRRVKGMFKGGAEEEEGASSEASLADLAFSAGTGEGGTAEGHRLWAEDQGSQVIVKLASGDPQPAATKVHDEEGSFGTLTDAEEAQVATLVGQAQTGYQQAKDARTAGDRTRATELDQQADQKMVAAKEILASVAGATLEAMATKEAGLAALKLGEVRSDPNCASQKESWEQGSVARRLGGAPKVIESMRSEVQAGGRRYTSQGPRIPASEIRAQNGVSRVVPLDAIWTHNLPLAVKKGLFKNNSRHFVAAVNSGDYDPTRDLDGKISGQLAQSWWFPTLSAPGTSLLELKEGLALGDTATYDQGAFRFDFSPEDAMDHLELHKPTAFDGMPFSEFVLAPGDTWGLTAGKTPEAVAPEIDVSKATKKSPVPGPQDADSLAEWLAIRSGGIV